MTKSKETRTELSEIGEFGLIDYLTKNIKIKNSSTIKGVGDDAAVINNQDVHTLVSTDLLIENVHFDLTYTPLKHLGYKSAIVNFSDIAAMNGIPKQITIGIAISNRFSVEAIEEFYKGIYLACNKYNVDLIGGDTVSSNSGLFISITVIGEAKPEKIVYRNGAKLNDLICVSGDLGSAYMGLLVLEREKKVFEANPGFQPKLSGNEYIIEKQIKPEARIDIIKLFGDNNILPSSMIDISDGLASEILHLCNDSKTGCMIYEDKIPIAHKTIQTAGEFKIDPTIAALNGGEDYELLFTIEQKYYEVLKNIGEISVIGHITDISEGSNLVSRSGSLVPINAQGWDSFKKYKKDLSDQND